MSHLKLRSPRVYGYEALKVCSTFVFREDGWSGKTDIDPVTVVVNVFFPGHFQDRPTFGTDSYYFSGSKAFGDEVGLEADLNATASQGHPFVGS